MLISFSTCLEISLNRFWSLWRIISKAFNEQIKFGNTLHPKSDRMNHSADPSSVTPNIVCDSCRHVKRILWENGRTEPWCPITESSSIKSNWTTLSSSIKSNWTFTICTHKKTHRLWLEHIWSVTVLSIDSKILHQTILTPRPFVASHISSLKTYESKSKVKSEVLEVKFKSSPKFSPNSISNFSGVKSSPPNVHCFSIPSERTHRWFFWCSYQQDNIICLWLLLNDATMLWLRFG